MTSYPHPSRAYVDISNALLLGIQRSMDAVATRATGGADRPALPTCYILSDGRLFRTRPPPGIGLFLYPGKTICQAWNYVLPALGWYNSCYKLFMLSVGNTDLHDAILSLSMEHLKIEPMALAKLVALPIIKDLETMQVNLRSIPVFLVFMELLPVAHLRATGMGDYSRLLVHHQALTMINAAIRQMNVRMSASTCGLQDYLAHPHGLPRYQRFLEDGVTPIPFCAGLMQSECLRGMLDYAERIAHAAMGSLTPGQSTAPMMEDRQPVQDAQWTPVRQDSDVKTKNETPPNSEGPTPS